MVPLGEEQPGTGTVLLVQIGTVLWLKVSVPHMGKAVAGVCPSTVQPWAASLDAQNNNSTAMGMNFLNIAGLTVKNRLSLQLPLQILRESFVIGWQLGV
jgi:hypothetical protein